MQARISQLFIYPLKSARGLSVDALQLGHRGVAMDRRWMLIDRKGGFVSQRSHPQMALLGTEIVGSQLFLLGPRGTRFKVPPASGAELWTQVWEHRVRARRVGEAARAFVRWALEDPGLDMVEVASGPPRIKHKFGQKGPVAFADGYPLLMGNQASLADLNGRLHNPVGWERFRPNVVVEGLSPFQEESLGKFTLGELSMFMPKPCERCVIINTEQSTGKRCKEPLRTLASYRRDGATVNFGVNLIALTVGCLYRGAPLVIDT